jgi:hypothetical protein
MREPYRPISPHQTQSAQLVAGIATAIILAYGSLCGVARAQTTKGFMDYLKPTPITCSPLSSATWGVAGVLPRDTCNGIESTNGAGSPQPISTGTARSSQARTAPITCS